jgi:fermentation-respiration switch protein FrsA (DUF1100 family)
MAHPRRVRPRLPDGLTDPVEEVVFPSADGLWLRGWFLPASPGATTLIVCHGYRSSRAHTLDVGLVLRARGLNVLLFDFRAHGASDGRYTSVGIREAGDLAGVVAYLISRPDVDPRRLGGLGFSMGAAALILAAAERPEIGAIVADSSYAALTDILEPSFRAYLPRPLRPFRGLVGPVARRAAERLAGVRVASIRPVDAIGRISPRPVLLIHGAADTLVPPTEALRLYDAAGEPKALWLVPRAGHARALTLETETYFERLLAFFAEHLPARSPS